MAFDPNVLDTNQNIQDIAINTSGLSGVIGPQPATNSLSVTLTTDQIPLEISNATVTPTYSSLNSTSAQLGAGETFIGVGELMDFLVSIDISILSDQDSMDPTGLHVQFSQDNIIWNFDESYGVFANVGAFFSLSPKSKYFRLMYHNGPVATNTLKIQTTYYGVLRSLFHANADDDVPADQSVSTTKVILAGENNNHSLTSRYVNLLSTPAGLLQVDLSASGPFSISVGSLATSTLQIITNTSLSSIDGKTPALGQTTMTGSTPVVIASNQTAIPVTGTFFQATQPVSGTVTALQGTSPWSVNVSSLPLPSGAATSANQTTANTSLASIDSKLTSPITITGTITANLGTIDGASTSANQTTANTSLSSIDTKTLTAGQKTMANSSPVVLASDQSTLNVNNYTPGNAVNTYSCGVVAFTAAATPTDIFSITGSATKTIRILEIGVNGTSTVGVEATLQLIKRSTANTDGTNQTTVPHDVNNAAATALVKIYAANPTLGTQVGVVRAGKLTMPTPGSATYINEQVWRFDLPGSQTIVLRGTGEQLCLNLGGTTITGNIFNAWAIWTEE